MNRSALIALIAAAIAMSSVTIARADEAPKCYGLYVGQGLTAGTLAAAGKSYGAAPCVVMLYWDWRSATYTTKPLQEIWNGGAIPLITLEPWIESAKKGILLTAIAQGKEDATLEALGKAIRTFGHPVFVRFGHEMNGNWYPWSGASNGNNSAAYVAAFRHAHDVVAKAAAPVRVLWIFSVNAEDVPTAPWNRAERYFPGEGFVDAIGIDGYNWAGLKDWGPFKTADQIFNLQAARLRKQAPTLPLLITEVATAGTSDERRTWLEDFFRSKTATDASLPFFVWFDVAKEADWRIDAEAQARSAFRSGVASRWTSGREAMLQRFFP